VLNGFNQFANNLAGAVRVDLLGEVERPLARRKAS